MNKDEFVDKLAEKGKTTKKLAKQAIDMIFTTVADSLVAGQEVYIPGFGKFSVIVRKERPGVNPSTRKKINIPETKAPNFTAAKALKESIK